MIMIMIMIMIIIIIIIIIIMMMMMMMTMITCKHVFREAGDKKAGLPCKAVMIKTC